MKILNAMRSKMSGQTSAEFGSGERFPLTNDLKKAVSHHMEEIKKNDLSTFTFERRHSYYPHSKSDIVIYDAAAQVILYGRESDDGLVSIWR